jgi:hypothetical protein
MLLDNPANKSRKKLITDKKLKANATYSSIVILEKELTRHTRGKTIKRNKADNTKLTKTTRSQTPGRSRSPVIFEFSLPYI